MQVAREIHGEFSPPRVPSAHVRLHWYTTTILVAMRRAVTRTHTFSAHTPDTVYFSHCCRSLQGNSRVSNMRQGLQRVARRTFLLESQLHHNCRTEDKK